MVPSTEHLPRLAQDLRVGVQHPPLADLDAVKGMSDVLASDG